MHDDDFDRRLDGRLSAYESRIPDAEAPEPGTRMAARSRAALVGVGALGVAAAGILALVLLGGIEPSPILDTGGSPIATPGPSASNHPSAPAGSASPQEATPEVPSPSDGGPEPLEVVLRDGRPDTTQYVVGLAEGPSGAVAAVNVFDSAAIPPVGPDWNADGAIYVESPDGAWRRVETGSTFDEIRLASLVRGPDGMLVLHGGPSRDGSPGATGAWTSSDGETWVAVAVPQPGGEIAAGPLGFIMVSTSPAKLEISFSSDAVRWETTLTRVHEDGETLGVDAGAGPEGFVVAADVSNGGERRSVVLASSDGREWFEAPDQPAFETGSIVMEVAPIGANWVASGWSERGVEEVLVATWWSANGLDWEVGEAIGSAPSDWPQSYGSALVSIGGVVILSEAWATEGTDTRPLETWFSTDGRTWEPIGLGPESEVRAALPRGGSALLGGRLGIDGGEAVIWKWDVPGAE